MKKIITLANQRISKLFIITLANLLIITSLFAQAPEKMSYQAVVRNDAGQLVTNTQIGMQISILQGTSDGAAVYSEIQTPTTNANGLVSIEIGGGAGFASINWAAGPYFIKTEIALEAPLTNYTIGGTSQILSVPFAIAANTATTFDKLTSRGASVCDESTEGAMRYNPDTRSVEYCNGSNWIALGSGLNINLPTVGTSPVSSITASSAQSGGSISDNGGAEIIQKGVCWNTETLPTIANGKTLQGTGSGSFASSLTGLINNTLYYTRAYATNTSGTGYGDEKEFTTMASLTTTQASENTHGSFITGGDIQAGGNQPISARGVAYGTGANPDISGSKMESGTGTGVFSGLISSLPANTLYYLRAYATNTGGTNYGNQRSTATLAEVVSADQSSASINSITTGGEVSVGGGVSISARGIAYGTAENPDISGTKTSNGSGTGVFASTASELENNSLYHYRAYATNIGGTSYGENKTATTLASLTTREAIERTLTSFVTGGDIEAGGGQTISERGVVYGTSANPTILDTKVIASESGTGGFSVTLEGLSINTNNYYYRAYALNSGGVSYGNEYSSGYFDTAGEGFTDSRDGNSYATVWIGGKEWMAENLAYLPSVVGPGTGSSSTPYHYVYSYNGTSVTDAKATSNYQTYGVLYNPPAALNACPVGWHLPTDAEWSEMENSLIANGYNYDGTTTGNKIAKALAAESGWNSHTSTGTVGNTDYPEYRNKSGFTALPGGSRGDSGLFGNIGDDGGWQSATVSGPGYVLYRSIYYSSSNVARSSSDKGLGFSVRCIKD